jgi:hypothetical protein
MTPRDYMGIERVAAITECVLVANVRAQSGLREAA